MRSSVRDDGQKEARMKDVARILWAVAPIVAAFGIGAVGSATQATR